MSQALQGAPTKSLDIRGVVITRLEDAGRTLSMLPMPKNGRPSIQGSSWPDVVQSFWDVVGYAQIGTVAERKSLLALARHQPRFQADRRAIDRLDEVLGWLWLIGIPHKRKVVAARMLVHPVSLRHLHSWDDVAESMGTSSRSVRRWFDDGVKIIVDDLVCRPKK